MTTDPSALSEMTRLPPAVPDEEIRECLRVDYAIEAASLRPLGGERDQNMLVTTALGHKYVVHIANAAEPAAVTDLMDQLFLFLERTGPALPVQRIVLTGAGRPSTSVRDGLAVLPLRVNSYLEGVQLSALPEPTPRQAASVGRVLAWVDRALAPLAHPAADRQLLWDVVHARQVRPMIASIDDPEIRRMCREALDRFEKHGATRLLRLPRQIIHNDANPHNVLMCPEAPDTVAGLIDFGDALTAPRIVELANALAYMPITGSLAETRAAIAAYDEVAGLSDDELAVLPDAIAVRLVLSIAITAWRVRLHPDNAAYILKNARRVTANMRALSDLGWATAQAIFLDCCRRSHHAQA